MTRLPLFTAVCCVIAVLPADLGLGQAAAQDIAQPPSGSLRPEGGRWEIEFHVGGTRSSSPTAGAPSLPSQGATFATVSRLPSRLVSSWGFGDGAALLTQSNAMWPFATSRVGVIPLDPLLNSASVRRERGANFGLRIGRFFNQRFSTEASVEYDLGRLALVQAAIDGLEATRASVVTTLRDILFVSGRSVSATPSVRDRQGQVVVATGALNIAVMTRGRARPFVVLGGGLVAHTGPSPTASLVTEYSLMSLSPFQSPTPTFTETDTVTIRYSVARLQPTVVLGGGAKYSLASRWNLRVELRGQFTRNSLKILVNATPGSSAGTQVPGSFAIATATNPSIQFSGIRSLLPTPSTLSGPAIRDFVTFQGRGIQSQLTLTTGLAWRF